MSILLSLLSAGCYGGGDFLGGRASKDAPTVLVLLVVQISAGVGALVAVLIAADAPIAHDLVLGGCAGLASSVGLGLLYRGLAVGRMGVVAPVTAAVAAVVPVGWGILTGERPGTVVWIGVVVAIVAAILIGRERDETAGRSLPSVAIAIGAGTGLGISFTCYAATDTASGMWPLLSARLVGALVVGAVVAVLVRRGGPMVIIGMARRFAVVAGIADVTATVLLLLAVRAGLAVVVAPLTALAPAFTVVLAWKVLHEPVGRVQLAGLVLALVGVVLITVG